MEIFRRVVLMRLGSNPDSFGSGSPATPAIGATFPPATPPAANASPTRKLKLSSIIDPTLDAEIIQLTNAEVSSMYTSYKTRFGDHPSQDIEPTIDQLSALSQLIKSQTLPYADFSVWGPHGLRQLRKSVFTSYILNSATGEWSKREQPGPDSIQAWEKSFKTFRVAMLLLEAADPERLDGYLEFVKDLHAQFGPECWGVLYKADVRMRSEYHERLRRSLEETPRFGYSTANPWSAVYAASIKEAEYWAREVTTPATLLLARNKSFPNRERESSGSPATRRPSGQPKKKKHKKNYDGEDKSQWDKDAGHYAKNRKGIEICHKFNKGACGNGRPQSRCTANRSHQCDLCLGPHMASQCKGSKKPNNWQLKQDHQFSDRAAEKHPQVLKLAPKAMPAKPEGEASTPLKLKPRSPSQSPPHRRGRERPREASRSPIRRKGTTKPNSSSKRSRSRTPRKSTSSGTKQPRMPLWVPYRYGATNVDPQAWDDRPRALLLFSGRPRDGDIASFLNSYGWIVVVVDRVGPEETNLLDDKTARAVLADVGTGIFDVVGLATPCETLSPLRETPPGPRPLRSMERPEGLLKEELSKSEWEQLRDGNNLIKLSANVMYAQLRNNRPFWLENPEHGDDKVDLWKLSWIRAVIEKDNRVKKTKFDQCRLGAEVTKPTIIADHGLDLKDLAGLKCNHPSKEWRRADGSSYRSPHESLVQRWRQNEQGSRERASKKLGEYTAALSEVIAKAMGGVDLPRPRNLAKKDAEEKKYWLPAAVDFFGPEMEDKVQKLRDIENEQAIGGMRNPSKSLLKIPKAVNVGKAVFELLFQAAQLPPVVRLVDQLLSSSPAQQLPHNLVSKLRSLVLTLLVPEGVKLKTKTTTADTPLCSEIFTAWGIATGDPDSETLAEWLKRGAPLGYEDEITTNGIFPPVEPKEKDPELQESISRAFDGWKNHPSATEWEEDLNKLVKEAHSKGFCSIFDSMEDAESHIGRKPILNKLGVIVKEKGDTRKARIIWDLKESSVNKLCNQAERIILPKLSDVTHDALEIFRRKGKPSFLAVDIKDAFHNVPAGKDKAYTTASYNCEGEKKVLVYDVLVFGAVSSPTIWGRFAAWLGRSLTAINPEVKIQIYVDDPIMTFDSSHEWHRAHLGVSLLWASIAGFPIKLEKSDAGDKVKWIGASIEANQTNKQVLVTIPREKCQEVCQTISKFLSRPIIGRKQLQSLAGALSFIAGVVPHMRPFLGGLWAVLAATNEGRTAARNVVHTRRIALSLEWILAVLFEKEAPFVRTVRAFRENSGATIITDASTWGLGGVLLIEGTPKEFFSLPIPYEFIQKCNATPGDPKHMALWESLCLLVAARLWLTKIPLGSIARVKADNIAALYMLLKGKARDPGMSIVAREIALDQAKGCYELTLLQHLNTKLNKIADPLSRQHDPLPSPFPHELLEGATRIPIHIGSEFWKLSHLAKHGPRGMEEKVDFGFCV